MKSHLFQGGTEKLSDEETEQQLDKVVKLLAYISDKDLFSEFYRKKLARRLLNDFSASDELERSILSRLKQQCGAQFTSKVRLHSATYSSPRIKPNFDKGLSLGSCSASTGMLLL